MGWIDDSRGLERIMVHAMKISSISNEYEEEQHHYKLNTISKSPSFHSGSDLNLLAASENKLINKFNFAAATTTDMNGNASKANAEQQQQQQQQSSQQTIFSFTKVWIFYT